MITIYTDGSARLDSDNQWVGACSCAIYNHHTCIYQASYNLVPATSAMCELIAVANAIYTARTLLGDGMITVMSDSTYVVNGYKQILSNKTNKSSWKLLNELTQNTDIQIKKIPAHSDNIYNNHVDNLARTKLRAWFK